MCKWMHILVILTLVALLASTIYTSPYLKSSSESSFKIALFYYGWLNTSNILSYNFDILVFSAPLSSEKTAMIPVLKELKSSRPYVETFAYLHNGSQPLGLGSSFKEYVVNRNPRCQPDLVNKWIKSVERIIDQTKATYGNLINGVFLDEVDPGYFSSNPSQNDPCVNAFINAIKTIVNYAHSKGLKVFINGVRYFAQYADLYLWEGFITIYDSKTSSYKVDMDFFAEKDNGNPLEWENGYGKYLWLKEHGLLSKTIALSYAPIPDTLGLSIYGYLMARILGLVGWGIANNIIFSNGGWIELPCIPPLGAPITPPILNATSMNATRVFTLGYVSVRFPPNGASPQYVVDSTIFNYREQIIVDGYLDSTGYRYLGEVQGVESSLKAYYAYDGAHLCVYIEASFPASTPIIGHIYIDIDNSASTGYRYVYLVNGSHIEIGADYMVEIYESYAETYKYAGSGNDWEKSWEKCNAIEEKPMTIITNAGNNYKVEMCFYMPNAKRILIATYNEAHYQDDAAIMAKAATTFSRTLSIFDFTDYSKYLSQSAPVISYSSLKGSKFSAEIWGPSGTYQTYVFYVPFKPLKVLKDGASLKHVSKASQLSGRAEGWYAEQLSSVWKVLVRIHHSSSTITILGASTATAAGGGGSILGGIGQSLAMLLIIAVIIALAAVSIRTYRSIHH